MVCEQKGSTYVSKIYPLEIGKMLQSGGEKPAKSIDLYIESKYVQKLKEFMEMVSDDKILHLILMDVTQERNSKRIQMMVEECDRIPKDR